MRAEPRLLAGSAACGLLLVLALWPATAVAQDADGSAAPDTTAAPGDTAAAGDTAATVSYRREIFTYPSTSRSDPFRPPSADVGMGPRFEDLALAGIIHAPEVGSVAILQDRSTGERHRVRDGESLGGVRVVEIRPAEVVFSVSGVTGERREVLRATSEEEGNQ